MAAIVSRKVKNSPFVPNCSQLTHAAQQIPEGVFLALRLKTHAAAAIAGNGQVAHIAFRVFDAYGEYFMREHKRLVQQVLEAFIPNKRIRTEKLNSTARVTACGCDEFTLVNVKVDYPELRNHIGIVEEHTVQAAGAKVSLFGEYKAACLLPCETPLDMTFENGYTTVTLPEFEAFTMIRFDK